MLFDVGDKVVYPHHGAAIVERREKREVFGETRDYLVLKLAYGDLTLMVPADNVEEVGLREVINDEEVAEVVRNLSIRDKDKGLSAGEKRMLTKARQILVSELTFAIGVTEEEAEAKLDEALP